MPEILRMFGMRFFFYSREHEPIHVHVKNADGKAKFDILPEGIVLVKKRRNQDERHQSCRDGS